jgi:two-component system response regulator YesN
MDQRVEKVIVLMKKNLQRRLTLTHMSLAVNLTPSHLCRVFKVEMGESPAKYFKWLRMQKAKELLENNSFNVKAVMRSVGLRDESHFVRDFEMIYGLTPAKYRAQYRSTNVGKISGAT